MHIKAVYLTEVFLCVNFIKFFLTLLNFKVFKSNSKLVLMGQVE